MYTYKSRLYALLIDNAHGRLMVGQQTVSCSVVLWQSN